MVTPEPSDEEEDEEPKAFIVKLMMDLQSIKLEKEGLSIVKKCYSKEINSEALKSSRLQFSVANLVSNIVRINLI